MSRFPLNLQLFAEGANEPEPAEPTIGSEVDDSTPAEPEGSDGEGTGANEPEPAEPVVDRNAIYAEARRAAEGRINAINSRVSSRFGKMKNPETGQPIRSAEDYFDALEAQERMNARQEMQQKGIDPGVIDRLISENPVIKQAQQVIRENNLRQGEMELEAQIQQISAIDPSIKSLADIAKMPTFELFNRYVVGQGLNLVDAYRLANFEALAQRDAAASRQAAINSAKGKSHLSPIGGGAGDTGKELVDIPKNVIDLWESAYPGLSYKELKEKYNRSL